MKINSSFVFFVANNERYDENCCGKSTHPVKYRVRDSYYCIKVCREGKIKRKTDKVP